MCSTVDISYFIFKYCRKFDSLFKNSQDISSMDGIDNCVESFVDILYSVCKPLFEKKLPTFKSIIPHKNIQMSYTTRNMKFKNNMVFFTCLNRYRNCRNDENRIKW